MCFLLIKKYIHEHNVSFHKTLTKLVIILTKCFFSISEPYKFLKCLLLKRKTFVLQISRQSPSKIPVNEFFLGNIKD